MTGFGAARREVLGTSVNVEIKSVNGRFLKVSLRLPSSLSAHETELESLVRAQARRGSFFLTVELRASRPEARVNIDEEVVRAYQAAFARLDIPTAPLATLPGVIVQRRDELDEETVQTVQAALKEAMSGLVAMREQEGRVLARLLLEICDRLADLTERAGKRAPEVVREYQRKLHERVQKLLGDIPADKEQLAREVATFADRCDVQEELDRLRAHIAQIRALVGKGDEAGRTLDFLSQELLREANTLGSKSQDAELSQVVVAMKTEIERFKEQVANVE